MAQASASTRKGARESTLNVLTKGYWNGWTPEQWSSDISQHAQAEEDEGLSSCFGRFASLTSFFPGTTTKERTDRFDCHSWQRAGNAEPIDSSSPRSELDRNTNPHTCASCEKSFSQPEFLHFHIEMSHAVHELGSSKGGNADRTLAMTDNAPSSPTETLQMTLSNVCECTLGYASPPPEDLTRSPTPTPLSSSTQKPKVLAIMSFGPIKAFVEVQKGLDWIQQGPQTYTWETFRGMNGAREVVEDFLIKSFA